MTDQSDIQPDPEQLAATGSRPGTRIGASLSQNHHETIPGVSDRELNARFDDKLDAPDVESSDQSSRDVKGSEIVPESRDGIPDDRDVEKEGTEVEQPTSEKAQPSKDPNLV